jgi:hypothetical protein
MAQKTANPVITKVQFFTDLLKDPDRKSLFRMFYEFVYLFLVQRKFPGHYFSRYLFKKGKTNILDYYHWRFLYGIKKYFNDKDVREVLENKLYFDLFYKQFSISLPNIIMFNHRNIFATGGKSFEVNNVDEFKALLTEIFNKNTASDSMIIKRTAWSYGGDRVFKIYKNQAENEPELINELFLTVIKSGFLFQDTVRQHKELDKLNPSCLNTMRIDTFINPDGKIDIISCYIRMSFRNAHVDNISSGGLLVGIDRNTGKLRQEGFSNLQDVGVKIFTEHPVTKTVFENFQIPFFEQAKELALKATGLMPGLRLVGWDVAIGESGPVLIEGNSDYDNTGNDLSEGGYRTNDIFRKVLKEYRILKKGKNQGGKRT